MPSDNDEFQRLTTLLIEDRISEAELAELNRLLAADGSLVGEYVNAREVDIAIRIQAWTPRSASQALIVYTPDPVAIPQPSAESHTSSLMYHLRAAGSILITKVAASPTFVQILMGLIILLIGLLIGLYLL